MTLAEGTENSLINGGSFEAIDDNNIDGAVFSKQDLSFNGAGSLTVSSPAGHGIVCKDDLVVTGGSYVIESASHGLDANGSIEISGGYITVEGPTQGDTATLDYDTTAVITGGTFIGTGASGMAQSFSSSEQGVIAVSVGSQSAGTELTVTDAQGETLLSWSPGLDYNVFIYSSPQLVSGASYTGTAGTGIGFDKYTGSGATEKTTDEFASGEVAWLLNTYAGSARS